MKFLKHQAVLYLQGEGLHGLPYAGKPEAKDQITAVQGERKSAPDGFPSKLKGQKKNQKNPHTQKNPPKKPKTNSPRLRENPNDRRDKVRFRANPEKYLNHARQQVRRLWKDCRGSDKSKRGRKAGR